MLMRDLLQSIPSPQRLKGKAKLPVAKERKKQDKGKKYNGGTIMVIQQG